MKHELSCSHSTDRARLQSSSSSLPLECAWATLLVVSPCQPAHIGLHYGSLTLLIAAAGRCGSDSRYLVPPGTGFYLILTPFFFPSLVVTSSSPRMVPEASGSIPRSLSGTLALAVICSLSRTSELQESGTDAPPHDQRHCSDLQFSHYRASSDLPSALRFRSRLWECGSGLPKEDSVG